jgi:hypothetical protein
VHDTRGCLEKRQLYRPAAKEAGTFIVSDVPSYIGHHLSSRDEESLASQSVPATASSADQG